MTKQTVPSTAELVADKLLGKKYKLQVGGVKEQTWFGNAKEYDTEAEAREAALDLLGRWMGADIARVVPVETPCETIDITDPKIVINYRR